MSMRRTDISEAIGTDAFLDIVANLVGILLILIMVIGVRMDDASNTAKQSTQTQSASAAVALPMVTMPNPDAVRAEVGRIEQSIHLANEEKEQLAELTQLQKLDRDNLMVAVTHAKQVLAARRATLDEHQRTQLDDQLRLQQSQAEFDSLVEQLEAAQLAEKEPPRKVLQHLATPLAKTVFVQEEHFRLKAGRLVFVPLNELTVQLKREAPKKLWKLKNAPQTTESIGPQDGFLLRYTLRRNRLPFRTESGISAARDVVELDRFMMVPLGELQGETIEEAMQPASAFRRRLSGWSASETIITVWVYPDSFGEFRKLKGKLHALGFLTAARPIPENQLISGSPHGTRSAAQ